MNEHDACKAALEAAAKRIEELERENAELRKRPTLDELLIAGLMYADHEIREPVELLYRRQT